MSSESWTITVSGFGPHHTGGPEDADVIAAELLQQVVARGHSVDKVSFVANGTQYGLGPIPAPPAPQAAPEPEPQPEPEPEPPVEQPDVLIEPPTEHPQESFNLDPDPVVFARPPEIPAAVVRPDDADAPAG